MIFEFNEGNFLKKVHLETLFFNCWTIYQHSLLKVVNFTLLVNN